MVLVCTGLESSQVPHTFFVLEEAKPVNIFAVGSWFTSRQAMLDAHNGNLDEFSDMQGELPF